MYSADDMILIQQLNDMAAGRAGLPEMRSTGSVQQLLATKPFQMPAPGTPMGYSAGRPDMTAMPDGPARTPIGSAGTRASSAASQGMLDAAGLYGDLSGQFYDGMGRPARQAKAGAGRMIGRGGRKMAGNVGAKLAAVPGMAKVGAAAKVLAPGLGALGGALAVGDLVLGDESAANKTMDAAAMAAGGFLGSIGGPLGTAAGVGLGKMASDGIQYLFGDKKTPEQRRMEEALAALGGGRI